MVHDFYVLPIRSQDLFDRKKLQKCSLSDSIRQHIHLLLKTHFKENRFDPAFGSVVWEKDFETIRSIHKWKNELSESFQLPIEKYEKRISRVIVKTDLDELKIKDPQTLKVVETRRRIAITVEGLINKTNEAFYHTEYIFFSPLSLT